MQATVTALRAAAQRAQSPSRDLWVKGRAGHQRISVEQIDYIAAERDYARVVIGDRSFLLPETMTALTTKLAPFGFLRIHRSLLIRRDAARGLERRGNGALVVRLDSGVELPVSRSQAAAVRGALGLISPARP